MSAVPWMITDSHESLLGTFRYIERQAERTEDDRECYASLHKILLRIFGFDEASNISGWLLEAETDDYVYDLIVRLLEPDGPLFKILFKYYNSSHNLYDVFQFPFEKLSYGMQYFLRQTIGGASGVVGSFDSKMNTAFNGILVNSPSYDFFLSKIGRMIQEKRGPPFISLSTCFINLLLIHRHSHV